MARMSDTLTLTSTKTRVCTACRMTLETKAWKLINDHGWAFMAKERVDMLGRMFRYPVEMAIFVYDDNEADDDEINGDETNDTGRRTTKSGPSEIRVEFTAATFGFGPLPKRSMRTKINDIKQALQSNLS
jgi:hypothetical protein